MIFSDAQNIGAQAKHLLRGVVFCLFITVLGVPELLAQETRQCSESMKKEAIHSQEDEVKKDVSKSKLRQEIMSLRKRMQELHSTLKGIENTALKQNPELKEEKEAFRTMFEDVMEQNMDAAGVDETRFKELRQKLTSSELQEKEHNKLMEEYEQQAKALRKAQSQTVNDQEIQATREKLFQKTIQAMKEVDPKSEEMFNSLKSTRKRLMDLQKQWMSSQEAKTHNE